MRHGRAVRGDNCDNFGNFDDLGVKNDQQVCTSYDTPHMGVPLEVLFKVVNIRQMFCCRCEVVNFSRYYLVDAVCISYYIFPQMPCEAENVNIPVPLGLAYRPQTHSCDWPDLLTGNILGHM